MGKVVEDVKWVGNSEEDDLGGWGRKDDLGGVGFFFFNFV